MPQYQYKCAGCDHEKEVGHQMFGGLPIMCDCGSRMHKVPTMPSVNWNGAKPSQGGLHPLVEQLNATYDQRVDEFAVRVRVYLIDHGAMHVIPVFSMCIRRNSLVKAVG